MLLKMKLLELFPQSKAEAVKEEKEEKEEEEEEEEE
jgi:hypothetical protein